MAANKSNEAFKQELAPVRLVDRSWVSDCDLRSRLFVERALPMYFVHDGFRQIPTVAINPSNGTPNAIFPIRPHSRSLTGRAHFHDRFPGFRRQLAPRDDKFAQGQIGAGKMQTGGICVDATIFLSNSLWILGRGCNSRRLHFF